MVPRIQIVSKLPRGLLHVIQHQLTLFQKWLDPLLSETNKHSQQLKGLRESLDGMVLSYKDAMQQLEKTKVEEARPLVQKPQRRKSGHRKKSDTYE